MGKKRFSSDPVPARHKVPSLFHAYREVAPSMRTLDTPAMATKDTTAVQRFSASELSRFSRDVFLHCDLAESDAEICAQSLVWADLHGIDTHGVPRIPAYVERFRRKLANPRPSLTVESRIPFAARLDGDNAMGRSEE